MPNEDNILPGLTDLTDLREMLDVPVLRLPIGGRVYVVQPCAADDWLRLQEINSRVVAAAEQAKTKAEAGIAASSASGVTDLEMYKRALGGTFDEMLKGKVTAPELQHAGVVAYYWQLGNEDVALAMWESAGKAPAATPAPPQKASTRTSTAGASTTRRRASTKATTTRKR